MSNQKEYAHFMSVCHPHVPTHIEKKTRDGKLRKVPNPAYYSGICKQQFNIARRYAESKTEKIEVALDQTNARLDEANAKIETLSTRVLTLEQKREQTEKLIREAYKMLEEDGVTISKLHKHIYTLETRRRAFSQRISDYRETIEGLSLTNDTGSRETHFTEEWHIGKEGTVYFVNPKTNEVMAPWIETHPIVGIREGDIESGFTLAPV